MTEYQNLENCVELHVDLEKHAELQGSFKRIIQESPLSSSQEDQLIADNKSILAALEGLYSQVLSAYFAEIIAARAV